MGYYRERKRDLNYTIVMWMWRDLWLLRIVQFSSIWAFNLFVWIRVGGVVFFDNRLLKSFSIVMLCVCPVKFGGPDQLYLFELKHEIKKNGI